MGEERGRGWGGGRTPTGDAPARAPPGDRAASPPPTSASAAAAAASPIPSVGATPPRARFLKSSSWISLRIPKLTRSPPRPGGREPPLLPASHRLRPSDAARLGIDGRWLPAPRSALSERSLHLGLAERDFLFLEREAWRGVALEHSLGTHPPHVPAASAEPSPVGSFDPSTPVTSRDRKVLRPPSSPLSATPKTPMSP